MAEPDAPTLVAEALAVRIDAATLSAPVDFTAGPGARLAVEAKGGAVAARVLRTLAGLRHPEAGGVRRAGGPLAYVFAEGGLLAAAPLEASVGVPVAFAGLPADRVGSALRRFGIAHLAEARPAGVGAEARRLAQYARAHALGARLLFVEEPLARLSPAGAGLVVDWLEERVAGGALVVSARQDGSLPDGLVRVADESLDDEAFLGDDE